VTPDDMYHDRQREIFTHRAKIKRFTLHRRKKENLRNTAWRRPPPLDVAAREVIWCRCGAGRFSDPRTPLISED
jgi:hypothetical protein